MFKSLFLFYDTVLLFAAHTLLVCKIVINNLYLILDIKNNKGVFDINSINIILKALILNMPLIIISYLFSIIVYIYTSCSLDSILAIELKFYTNN